MTASSCLLIEKWKDDLFSKLTVHMADYTLWSNLANPSNQEWYWSQFTLLTLENGLNLPRFEECITQDIPCNYSDEV